MQLARKKSRTTTSTPGTFGNVQEAASDSEVVWKSQQQDQRIGMSGASKKSNLISKP